MKNQQGGILINIMIGNNNYLLSIWWSNGAIIFAKDQCFQKNATLSGKVIFR